MTKSFEFQDQEAQEGKKYTEGSLRDVEAHLVELNEYLKAEINYLEASLYRFKDMEQYNSFIDEMKSDKEMVLNEENDKYSPKDIVEINEEINIIQKHIKEVKNHISQYMELKEDSKNLIDQFNQLENALKVCLTTIRPEQNQ